MTKKTILIADDEPNIVNLVKIILGKEYRYLEADDGEKVLNLLKKHRPDLILLDVMMPKVNGFEICEMLKKDSTLKKIPIAMVSAKAQERDIIQGLRLGADYYITKPFDPERFEMQIKAILKKAKKNERA
ncbi:MAG: response regulator [Candidatus Woesearchaeota archaeon]